jgi:hypothetical protein
MEKINIVEIAQDPQVINAFSNFKTALNELLIQPHIQEVINKTSRDEAELAFFLSGKLPGYFPSINTADENWPVSLIRWSSTVVTNRSRNIWKTKNTTEKNYEALVDHLNSSGKRNSQRIFISATPEDELSIAEQG